MINSAHCAGPVRKPCDAAVFAPCPSLETPSFCPRPCRHAELSRAFVPGGCWFFTVNLLERRDALRLLRPTAATVVIGDPVLESHSRDRVDGVPSCHWTQVSWCATGTS